MTYYFEHFFWGGGGQYVETKYFDIFWVYGNWRQITLEMCGGYLA